MSVSQRWSRCRRERPARAGLAMNPAEAVLSADFGPSSLLGPLTPLHERDARAYILTRTEIST